MSLAFGRPTVCLLFARAVIPCSYCFFGIHHRSRRLSDPSDEVQIEIYCLTCMDVYPMPRVPKPVPFWRRRSDDLRSANRGGWFGVPCPGQAKDVRPSTSCWQSSARAQDVIQCKSLLFFLSTFGHVQWHTSIRGGCQKLSICVSSFEHACRTSCATYFYQVERRR